MPLHELGIGREGRGGESVTRTFGGIEVHHVETFESVSAGFHDFRHVLDSVANQLVPFVVGHHLQFDVVVADTRHRQTAGRFRLEPFDQVEPSGDFAQIIRGRARVRSQLFRSVERHLEGRIQTRDTYIILWYTVYGKGFTIL